MTIGSILRRERHAFNLTQAEVARRGGPNVIFQSNVERGKTTTMKICTLVSYCKAIGCDVVDVFADYVEKRHEPPYPLESVVPSSTTNGQDYL